VDRCFNLSTNGHFLSSVNCFWTKALLYYLYRSRLDRKSAGSALQAQIKTEHRREGYRLNDEDRQANVQRLEHDLNEMEATLVDRYCSLGKQLLEVAEREDREINQLVDQIIEARKQLSQLRQTVLCPVCCARNSNASQYCSHCGSKLQKEG
jgi:hypothetical protein